MPWLERFWFSCEHCRDASCPMADGSDGEPGRMPGAGRRGTALVVPAMVVFLLPLLIAIGGAYGAGYWWAGDSPGSLARWQTAGAVVGGLVGVGMAKSLLGLRRRWVSTNGGT
jgi:hypothetical protein